MYKINYLNNLKIRKSDSNKGTYGKALIIGGSINYPGSIVIASSAALKCGAGYVCLGVNKSVYERVACINPEVIYEIFADDNFYDEKLLTKCLNYSSILFGNGIVNSKKEEALDYLISNYKGNLIIDAGGLDALKNIGLDKLKSSNAKIVLTPHLREFQRLFNVDITNKSAFDLKEKCKALAKDYNVVIDLKDCKSVITDGVNSYFIDNGNAGLAKAGSGDMLAGMIVSFAAYMNCSLLDIVSISHFIMNEACKSTSKSISLHSVTASDVIDKIGFTIKKYERIFGH